MSFNNFARKVRDPALPLGLRVSMLRSCVQLYRPIRFHATLDFLQARAGDFRRDEAALLRALEVLEAGRAAWQEELRAYAAVRREAKRRGRRAPRPGEADPHRVAYWHGAPRQAALHALRYESRKPGLFPAGDPVAAELRRCVTACLASGGRMDEAGLRALDECSDALEKRVAPDAFRDDGMERLRARDLLDLVHHVRVAAGVPRGATAPRVRR